MTRKKAIIVTLIIISALVAIPLGLYAAGNAYFTNARIMEENWDITLPADIKERYAKNGPSDFQGHGSRYAVFQTKNSDPKILNGSSQSKNSDMENAMTDILKEIDADQNQYPDFSGTYRWKILSKYTYRLYIVFDENKSLLYLVSDIP